jgi:hypothetical protein
VALNQYISDTQLLMHDSNGVFASQASYITWINDARSWTAGKTMCVRQLYVYPTVTNQEVYPMPTSTMINVAGVGGALGVLSIAVPWGGTLKPVMERFPWTKFQAQCRVYSGTTVGNPCVWAKFNDASYGSVYMYPIPQQAYNAEWDIWCDVLPLSTDTSPEAIPSPFTGAIKYYAAHLAMLNAQRPEDAANMLKMYEMKLAGARQIVTQRFLPSAYRS